MKKIIALSTLAMTSPAMANISAYASSQSGGGEFNGFGAVIFIAVIAYCYFKNL